MDINQLIVQAQSSDNAVRDAAESQLLQACDTNAAQIFTSLMKGACDGNTDIASRQFALLSLRKLITMYWSPGFESYRNTSTINDQTKEYIRESLLNICLDDLQDSKITKSAAYCVVQISAVDFPDQWPQLLVILYDTISQSHSLNAMSLLNEIYDDVVSEEMFFEGQIGMETLQIIFQVLSNNEGKIEAKIAATKLFNACILQMSVLDPSSSLKRKKLAEECIPKSIQVLGQLLEYYTIDTTVDSKMLTSILELRSKIYENVVLIKNELPKRLFQRNLMASFKFQTLKDLSSSCTLYETYCLNNIEVVNSDNLHDALSECSIHMLDFLTATCSLKFDNSEVSTIVQDLTVLCCLDNDSQEELAADFNAFVSKETGLLPSYTIRDQASEFLNSLSDPNYATILQAIINTFISTMNQPSRNDRILESILYLLQSLMTNEDDVTNINPNILLEPLSSLFDYETENPFLHSRLILLIPKILEKFMDEIPNVKVVTKDFLTKSLKYSLQMNDGLNKISALIGYTYYAYFAELPSVLGRDVCTQVQENILLLITQVVHESEEDTHGLLVEVLNHVIDCNPEDIAVQGILETEFYMVLSISSKDPANIQVAIGSEECLEKLLEGVNTRTYTHYIDMCLPSFINVIKGHSVTEYKYSPLLSLILEFVTVFMKKKPTDGPLPAIIFEHIFQPLLNVLNHSTEDETLQLATDAFSYLLYNTDSTLMIPHLEEIVAVLDRLLSINVSDTAAMNVGTLIVTIFSKFSNELQSLIPTILRAAVTKLVQAKNISTQQNLISLLCFLTCTDPLQTIEFLYGLDETHSTFAAVMNKWFEAFEVIRGEKKIKENILALSKLYFTCDPRLGSLLVNGDLIPYEGDLIITRSMAKTMPDKYTQIPAYTKIIKLFVSELSFQTQQTGEPTVLNADLKGIEKEEEEVGDDDEWEDVDDVLDYDKLKEYVDDEDPAEFGEDDKDEITGLADVKETVTELLLEFFKEVTSKDTNNFHAIYNTLSDNGKKILSENLL
ncbi:karyopherin KAP114 NDAI_0B06260 [Naumovozyma dairenensis CBS 421]|uniref:Importin N-terminal domain-containing protein n=1 Tax=Naumovozyma dairenensis (strain ATCC 10597 / BCRC 20456 / CBS 421 / NBRC 0211 / NRRL Y-12639) TaxID=1071378 RepID=G0W796_NAUDC|nr:hypothetical protein NDAI_0B06260 [Naumovozyma dairenensis CBS 421]CCD23657.1 hypothetical protein NDAI_0B06260 [Naumovozyma dairenensis CBS 421]